MHAFRLYFVPMHLVIRYYYLWLLLPTRAQKLFYSLCQTHLLIVSEWGLIADRHNIYCHNLDVNCIQTAIITIHLDNLEKFRIRWILFLTHCWKPSTLNRTIDMFHERMATAHQIQCKYFNWIEFISVLKTKYIFKYDVITNFSAQHPTNYTMFSNWSKN